jgi:hypothetical protein
VRCGDQGDDLPDPELVGPGMQALIVGAGRGSLLLPACRDLSEPLVPILVTAGVPLAALWP